MSNRNSQIVGRFVFPAQPRSVRPRAAARARSELSDTAMGIAGAMLFAICLWFLL